MESNNTPSSDERVLVFKTTKDYSTKQVFSAFIFLILGSVIIYFIVYEATDAIFLKVIVIVGFLIFFWNIGESMRSWFTNIFTLEISKDHVTGKNLFGREIKFKISDIVSVRKLRTWKALEFKTFNQSIKIARSIDFSGFIYDYILTKAEPSVANEKDLKKLRAETSYWKYSRNHMLNTKYEDGYLEWIYQQANEQKLDLINKGILKRNTVYGVADPDFQK
jgi:hypothetical protein